MSEQLKRPMLPLDLAELKLLAQAATPGPWTQWAGHGVAWSGGLEALGFMVCECDPNYYAGKDDEEAEAQAKATAAYIAAANPQTILALIERVRELEVRRIPTHRCRICGALWISYSDAWSLFSKSCGSCCDNADMGDQIEPLENFDPKAERKGTVRLTLEQARAIEAMPGPASTTMQITCPVCGAWRWNHPAENMRHAPDCWLAAAIREAERD